MSARGPARFDWVNDYSIEPATEEALPACLALLPPITHPDCIVFAARLPDGTLAGAAGLLWQSWGRPPGFPAWVHVLPDCRRRGIGAALARALVRRAEGESDALWAARPLAQGETRALFAAALGFTTAGRQFYFEADARRCLEEAQRLVRLLDARRRVPEGVRLAPLDQQRIPEVTAMLRSELPSTPPDIGRRMAESLDVAPADAPVDIASSRVLLVDGEIAGALVSRRLPEGAASILCNVVAPRFRGGWANVVLLESVNRAIVEGGCGRVYFDCEENNRDTLGIAKRAGARLLRTDALYRYALASAA